MIRFIIKVFTLCLLSLAISTPNLWSSQEIGAAGNGSLLFEVKVNGSWQKLGTVSFGKEYEVRQLDIPEDVIQEQTTLRITRSGELAAHIDALALGNFTPDAVTGENINPVSALSKLTLSDYDVLDMGKQIAVKFKTDAPANSLSIRARIEPPEYHIIPFEYPTENIYQEINQNSAFHTYKLDSRRGGLHLDGDLNNEDLKTLSFRTFARSGSGHPSGYICGWVWNDDKNLYAAVDFLPDNTMDGDKDFCRINVKTPDGVRFYRVSVPEQRWGKPGFGYTRRTAYQHKTYEFQIPFTELDSFNAIQDGSIELAFTAYGTFAEPLPPVIDSFTEPAEGEMLVCNPSSTVSSYHPLANLWAERDIKLTETVGNEAMVAFINKQTVGALDIDCYEGGSGTAQIVYDGPDNDALNIFYGNSWNASNFNRIELTNVRNTGTQPVWVDIKLYTDFGVNTAQSSTQTIAPGSDPVNVGWFFSQMTATPGFNPSNLNVIQLTIDNSFFLPCAFLTIEEIAFSDTPLPVNLALFSATLRNEGVLLNWATAAEQDNLGFYIYRCDNETDAFTKISPLIKGQGTTTVATEYSFLDKSVEWGQVYRYKLVSVNAATGTEEFGDELLVAADRSNITKNIPLYYALDNNYPNPFNAGTTIRFAIPEDNFTRLTVYDVTGKTVKILARQALPAGLHTYLWDGTDDSGNPVSTGAYFYELVAGDYHETRTMSLTK